VRVAGERWREVGSTVNEMGLQTGEASTTGTRRSEASERIEEASGSPFARLRGRRLVRGVRKGISLVLVLVLVLCLVADLR
jgi:hypothetical protein